MPGLNVWRMRSLPPQDHITEMFYFYDGELPVRDGVVLVPKDRPAWAWQLLNSGFRWAGNKQPKDWVQP